VATLSNNQPEPRRLHRLVIWTGHHANLILMIVFPIMFLNQFVPDSWALLGAGLAVLTILVMLGTMFADIRHNLGLCERCISDLPLDGSRQAEHRQRELRFVHFMRRRSFWLIVLMLAVGQGFVPSPYGFILFGGLMALFTYEHFALLQHRRLQPWCPWCRDWDDGDDEEVETPTPTPTGHKDLTRT
jgi:hypothetical protein